MKLKATTSIVFNRSGEIAGQLRSKAGLIARKTAFDVQRDYQKNCRKDTGAQAASAYVVTHQNSTYGDAAGAAQQASAGVELLPEVAHPESTAAYVAIGASYAALNEFGGHGHTGDGALTTAAEAHRQNYIDAMNKLVTS